MKIRIKPALILSALIILLSVCAGFLPVFAPATGPQTAVPSSDGFSDGEKGYFSGAAVSTSAAADILMEQSGIILSGKNISARMGMASTTKIMTALIAIERLDPDSVVSVPKEAVGIEGSSLYLTEGEKITVSDLLYGLMLESGNDAAVALAIAVSGSEEEFVELMNRRAEELGLEDTHFVNPHGLSDDDHYTTAYDLAKLTCAALENETFERIVSTGTAVISDGRRTLYNHNRLLGSYEGCIGVKTGYTIATGRTLVTAARRDGMTLVAVTLNDRSDWADHAALLDYGFDNFFVQPLSPPSDMSVSVVGGKVESVAVRSAPSSAVLPEGSRITVTVLLPEFAYAPVEAGEVVGCVEYYCGGRLVASLPAVAAESVEIKRVSFFERLFS